MCATGAVVLFVSEAQSENTAITKAVLLFAFTGRVSKAAGSLQL